MELTLTPVYINGKRYLPVEEDETLETIINAVHQLMKNRERARERYQAKKTGAGRKAGVVLHINKKEAPVIIPENNIVRQIPVAPGTPLLPVPTMQYKLCPLPQPCDNTFPSRTFVTNT